MVMYGQEESGLENLQSLCGGLLKSPLMLIWSGIIWKE